MMKHENKKWGLLTAAILLSLSSLVLPHRAQAATSVSGVGTTSTFNLNTATASGTNATAIGDGAKAYVNYSVAIGYNATVGFSEWPGAYWGINGIAIGAQDGMTADTAAKVIGNYGIAIGTRSLVSGKYAMALGYGAAASGTYSSALGGSKAYTDYSMAIGYNATVGTSGKTGSYGINGIAIGAQDGTTADTAAKVTGDYGIAIGTESVSSASYANALGFGANAYTNYSTAIGYKATVGTSGKTGSYGINGIAIGAQDGTTADTAAKVTGDYGIAIGTRSSATNTQATALGYSATASGYYSSALGGANAYTNYSTAIGYKATVGTSGTVDSGGKNGIAIGAQDGIAADTAAKVTANYGIAIGTRSSATNTQATALGYIAMASGSYSSALGYGATASGQYSSALGYTATASGDSSLALGDAMASGSYSSALGYGATASGQYSSALGGSKAYTDYSMAIGYNATVGTSGKTGSYGINGIAIGAQDGTTADTAAKVTANYGIAIGTRSSATNTQAIALGYESKASYSYATAVGSTASASGSYGSAFGYGATASNTNATALGYGATAVLYATAVGSTAKASGSYSSALGYGATASGSYSSALGYSATVSGKNGIAIGAQDGTTADTAAKVTENYGIAIGTRSSATNTYATALGYGATASGSYSSALGDATASGSYSSALGYGATASGQYSSALGGSKAYTDYSMAIGYNATVGTSGTVDSGGKNGIAIGAQDGTTADTAAKVTANYGIAIGTRSSATNTYATALGYGATASGQYSSALGYTATASGDSSLALGDAMASGSYSSALGYGATASGSYSSALGKAYAYTNYSTAIGYDATVGTFGTVDSGGLAGIAIGAGFNGSPAATVTGDYGIAIGGVSYVSAEYANALGYYAKAFTIASTAIGYNARVGTSGTVDSRGVAGIAIGSSWYSIGSSWDISSTWSQAANVTGDYGIAIGTGAYAAGQAAIALGYEADAWKTYATAVGSEARALGSFSSALGGANAYTNYSTAIGYKATVGKSGTVDSGGVAGIAIGSQVNTTTTDSSGISTTTTEAAASVTGDYGIAFGTKTSVSNAATKGMAMGFGATVTTASGVAIGDTANVGHASSVAIGANSATSEANSVSVGASTDSTRTITNVTAGDSTKDAAIWDQIAANYVEGTTNDIVLNTANPSGEIKSNDDTTLAKISIEADGSIVAQNTGLISGGTAYTELRPVSSTNYIAQTNTTAANLSALDLAIGKTTQGHYIIAQTGAADANVATNLKKLDDEIYAQSRIIRVSDDDTTKMLVGNGTEYANVATIDVSNSGTARTITGVAAGSQATDAATYGQLVNAQAKTTTTGEGNDAVTTTTYEVYEADDDGIVTVKTNNNGTAFKIKVGTSDSGTVEADGVIDDNDTGLISGGAVYTELRPVSSTNYLSQTNTTAANLSALDKKIGAAKTANAALYAAADDVETQISKVAGNTIQSVTNATSASASKVQTSTLTMYDGTKKTIEVAGEGAVASGDVRLLNGSTVYTELRPVSSTNYLSQTKTTAANLSALDKKIGAAKTANANLYAAVDDVETQISKVAGKTIQSVTNATSASASKVQTSTLTMYDGTKKTIEVAGEGAVASGDVRLLSGGTAYTELRPVSSTNYLSQTKTTAANLSALDLAIGKTTQGHYIIAQTGAANANVATNLQKLDDAIYAQSRIIGVSDDDTTKMLVGNGTEYANVATIDVSNSGTARTITGVAAGSQATDAATYGQLVNAQAKTTTTGEGNDAVTTTTYEVYKAGDDGIVTVKTNDGGTAFKIKVGTSDSGTVEADGVIDDNNTGLISGGTVYTELRPVSSTNYLSQTNTTAANLSALDQAIGKTTQGHYIIAQTGEADANVATNLKKLDDAIYAQSQVVRVSDDQAQILVSKDDGGTRTITGVTAGDSTGDAAVWDQIAKKNQTVTVSVGGTADIQSNDNQSLYQITYTGMENVAANDTGFVSGSNLYAENRNDIASTNYIAKTSTAGANLSALDSAIGKTSQGHYIIAQTGAADANVATNLKKLDDAIYAQSQVVRVSDDQAQILVSKDDGGTRTITGVTAGDSTGDAAVWDQIAKKNQTVTVSVGGTADIQSNDNQSLYKITYTGMENVSANDTGFVSGANLYAENRNAIASTNYIAKTSTAGANLSALDSAIGKTSQGHYIIAQTGAADANVATNLKKLDDAIYAQSQVVRVSDDQTQILVSKGDGGTRTITSVTAGDSTGDAAVWDQIAKKNQTVTVSVGGTADIQSNDNQSLYQITYTGMENVSANDTGFVSGANLYAENRNDIASTNYIAKTSTAGANLSALDSAIGKTTQGHYIIEQTGEADANVATNLKKLDDAIYAQSQVVRVSDDQAQILVSKDDGATRTITGVTAGDSTGDVAVWDQIAKKGQTISVSVGSTADIQNNDNQSLYKITYTGMENVEAGDTGFVSGDDLYKEIRQRATGTYVSAENDTGTNLSKLDAAVVALDKSTATSLSALDTQVKTHTGDIASLKDLDNITDKGQAVIKNLSKDAVKVGAGSNVSVAENKDTDGNITYTVSADLENSKELAGKVSNDASNIGVNLKPADGESVVTEAQKKANLDAWGAALGTGTVDADSAQLITGATLYSEVRPTSDGTYVKTGESTATNLSALDTQVKFNYDDITKLKKLSNITSDGKDVIRELSKNAVKVGAGDNVSVVENKDADGNITYMVSADLEDLEELAGKVSNDASNIGVNLKAADGVSAATEEEQQANLDAWGAALGTGTVDADSAQLITGATLYSEVRPTSDGTYVKSGESTATNLSALDTQVKFNYDDITKLKNLSNITSDGEDVIRALSKNAVKVGAGDNVSIEESEDADGNITYILTADLENSTELAEKVSNSANNIGANLKAADGVSAATEAEQQANLDAWGSALGTGIVAVDSAQLITGATLYNEVRPESDGSYVKSWGSTASNFIALDTQVKTNYDDITDLKDLSNITDEGQNVVKNLAKDAVVSSDLDKEVLAVKVNNDASNIGVNLKGSDGVSAATKAEQKANLDAWGAALGTGTVAQDSSQLITGATLYSEVRPTSNGTYVKTGESTATNLSALDAQVKFNYDDITKLKNLSNITSDGKDVIRELSKSAVKVGAGDNVSVKTSKDDDGNITYTVSADLKNSKELFGKVDNDASNIGANLKGSDGVSAATKAEQKANLDAWGAALGTGTVAQDSSQLITGATLYSEVRPTSNGTYVKTGESTATNLSALDTQVAKNATNISNLGTRVTSIESTIGGIGDQIAGTKVDGSEITLSKANKTATVNHVDGTKAFSITIEGLGEGGATYTKGDGIEISEDNKISVKVGDDLTVSENGISVKKDGTVASGSTGLVTGGTVYTAIAEKAGDTTKLSAAGLGDNLTDSVLNVNDKVGTLSQDISKVGAGAAALAALRPEGFDPGDKWSFAVGYGHYKSANAGALGAFYKPNPDTTISIGGTIGNGDPMMNAGLSFKLGTRGKGAGIYQSNRELVQEVSNLRADTTALKESDWAQNDQIAAQARRIAMLEAENARIKQQVAVILSQMELSNQVAKSATR